MSITIAELCVIRTTMQRELDLNCDEVVMVVDRDGSRVGRRAAIGG